MARHRLFLDAWTLVVMMSAMASVAGRACLEAGVPTPMEPGAAAPGKPTPAEELPMEKRRTHFPRDPKAPYPEFLKAGAGWQSPVQRGPNALYVLLRLCGKEVTREDVLRRVPVAADGTSLASLSTAANQLGLPHRVVQVADSQLKRLTPPFLVHENVRDEKGGENGHFFVVVRFMDSGETGIVDGVSGAYQIASPERIAHSFSGYALIPDEAFLGLRSTTMRRVLYGVGAVAAALLLRLLWVGLFDHAKAVE